MPETTITFLAPLPPPGLRRNTLSPRYGWLKLLRRDYSEAVYVASRVGAAVTRQGNGASGMPWKQAHVELDWRSRRRGPDADNALASCKALIDCLRMQRQGDSVDDKRYWLGIIEDDGADVTMAVTVTKIRAPEPEGVLVTVRRVEP